MLAELFLYLYQGDDLKFILTELQFLVIIYGMLATLVPAVFCVYFWQGGPYTISRALSWMLAGETISSAVAVFFSVNSYAHTYNAISPFLAAELRLIIYTCALASTIHLSIYLIRRVNHGKRRNRRATDQA